MSVPAPAPWSTPSGVVKMLEFPVRLPSLSRRAFHLYWQRHHSPHVMNVTAFAQYIRKYMTAHVYPDPVPGLPQHFRQSTPYEGASELWLNSVEELNAWLGQDTYRELIQPDEPRFILQDGSGALVLAREERLYEPQPDMVESNLTKLYLLVKCRTGVDRKAGHAAISQYAQQLLEAPSLRDRLRKLAISHKLGSPLPDGMVLANVDAILELWFDHRAAMVEFFADGAYRQHAARHEADAFDSGDVQALVVKLRVIHDEYSFQPSTTQPFPFSWET